jgi:hypothetical protein
MRHLIRVLSTLGLFLLTGLANAADVRISWTPSSTCDDGSVLSNCPTTGIEVLTGASLTGTYTTVETLPATATAKTYTGVAPGTKCYSLKTVSNSLKSTESQRACVDVPFLPPKAPAGITVTVVVSVSGP